MLKAIAVLNTEAIVKGIMIRSKGVDFSGEIPLLDSHSLRNQPLGPCC
jgi:hypothetical protein